MAKRRVEEVNDEPELELTDQATDYVLVSTVHDRSIINGHVLKAGTVVALTDDDIEKHREAGVPLEDVEDGDPREVYDVLQPFVAEDNGAE